MYFVVYHSRTGSGETLQDAVDDYEVSYGEEINMCAANWYEGKEIQVKVALIPIPVKKHTQKGGCK